MRKPIRYITSTVTTGAVWFSLITTRRPFGAADEAKHRHAGGARRIQTTETQSARFDGVAKRRVAGLRRRPAVEPIGVYRRAIVRALYLCVCGLPSWT